MRYFGGHTGGVAPRLLQCQLLLKLELELKLPKEPGLYPHTPHPISLVRLTPMGPAARVSQPTGRLARRRLSEATDGEEDKLKLELQPQHTLDGWRWSLDCPPIATGAAPGGAGLLLRHGVHGIVDRAVEF